MMHYLGAPRHTLLMIELHIRLVRSNIALWDVVNMPNCYEQMSTRNFPYPQPCNGENARRAIMLCKIFKNLLDCPTLSLFNKYINTVNIHLNSNT